MELELADLFRIVHRVLSQQVQTASDIRAPGFLEESIKYLDEMPRPRYFPVLPRRQAVVDEAGVITK